jgi:hypothetical protein
MLYFPPIEYNGSVNPEFNVTDFEKSNEYATKGDLLSYANLFQTNFFQSVNYFTNLQFSNNINDVSVSAFSYIQNLTQDVQERLNQLPNITYFLSNNTTGIAYNTVLSEASVNNNMSIGNNLSIGNTINTNTINAINTYSQNISCDKITCNSQDLSVVGCYLFINYIYIPIIKSINMSQLNISITSLTLHLKNNYSIQLKDSSNNVLYSISNTSNTMLYNQNVSNFNNLSQILLYRNNIQLI